VPQEAVFDKLQARYVAEVHAVLRGFRVPAGIDPAQRRRLEWQALQHPVPAKEAFLQWYPAHQLPHKQAVEAFALRLLRGEEAALELFLQTVVPTALFAACVPDGFLAEDADPAEEHLADQLLHFWMPTRWATARLKVQRAGRYRVYSWH
jgi:hypothetical protein